MSTTPKYRDDIKGRVAENIADFKAACAGAIKSADHFVMEVEEVEAYHEYKDILTITEMRRAFKAALKEAA